MKSDTVNLHFIRHAHTTFNRKNQLFKLRDQRYHALNFDQLSLIQQFRNQVRFCHSQIDCSLTEQGINQCKRAFNLIKQKNIKPDLILVSPFNRTLETCHQIFGAQKQIPIIVQPLIGQILKSSCDISEQICTKIAKYSTYDFSECQKLGNHWYIKKNSSEHKKSFDKILQQHQQKPLNEVYPHILKQIDQENSVQTQQHLLQRCKRAIKKIHDVYSQNYKEIIVITHFMFLDCISATKYDQNHTPLNGRKANNCQVYTTKLKDLIQKL